MSRLFDDVDHFATLVDFAAFGKAYTVVQRDDEAPTSGEAWAEVERPFVTAARNAEERIARFAEPLNRAAERRLR